MPSLNPQKKALPRLGWIIIEEPMQKRVKIANELISKAQRATGIHTPSELVHTALTALIQKEAADALAMWAANRPTIESVHGDRMSTEPIEVTQALKAAYEAAIEGDKNKATRMDELRQFDTGTHPAQSGSSRRLAAD